MSPLVPVRTRGGDARSWGGTEKWGRLLGHRWAHPGSFFLRQAGEGEVGSEDWQGMPQPLEAEFSSRTSSRTAPLASPLALPKQPRSSWPFVVAAGCPSAPPGGKAGRLPACGSGPKASTGLFPSSSSPPSASSSLSSRLTSSPVLPGKARVVLNLQLLYSIK